MSENHDKNIRIPVAVKGEHVDHEVGITHLGGEKGLKAVFCLECREFISFMANKKKWEDKVEEFKALIKQWSNQKYETGKNDEGHYIVLKFESPFGSSIEVKQYLKSETFILKEDIEDSTLGFIPTPKQEPVSSSERQPIETDTGSCIIKADSLKQIVYGVFLVPEKADHHGDVISHDDVEMVAHKFLAEYRDVDEMHQLTTIQADVIESAIAWEDGLKYHGQEVAKGTWFGAIKIRDKEVWDKVVAGTYKAFSVRISGVREPIEGEE